MQPEPLSKGRRSRAETFALRLQDPIRRAAYEAPNEGPSQLRTLAQSTLAKHALIERYLHEFAKQMGYQDVIPDTLVPHLPVPSLDVVKEFIKWLAMSLTGSFEEHITFVTMRGYIWTFWALWRRATGSAPSSYDRDLAIQYIRSPALKLIAPLSTKKRTKHSLCIIDVSMLINHAIDKPFLFQTKRMLLQFITILLIQCLSSERPCSLVESTCRAGSNMSLWYSHIRVFLVPNPENAYAPIPLIALTPRFLKGHALDESFYRTFFLYCESPQSSLTCPVRYLLTLCFIDKVFIHFPNIHSLFHPTQPVTKLIEAIFKPELKNTPIFRRESAAVDSNGAIKTSPDLAMQYHTYRTLCKVVSYDGGWSDALSPYDGRRAALYHMNGNIPNNMRDLLAAHPQGHGIFERFYQMPHADTVDLQGLFHKRSPNVDILEAFQSLHSRAALRDTDAPQDLSVKERTELEMHPELLSLKLQRTELLEEVDDLLVEHASSGTSAGEKECILEEVEELRAQAADLQKEYTNTFHRNYDQRVERNRREHHDNRTERWANGEFNTAQKPRSNSHKLLPERYSQGVLEINLPYRPQYGFDAFKGWKNIATLLTEESSFAQTPSQHCINSVQGLLELPEHPPISHYPGELPTQKEKCPVCATDLSSKSHVNRTSHGSASHIHACVKKEIEKDVSSLLDEAFAPQPCYWKGCDKSATLFNSRNELVSHLQIHLRWVDKCNVTRARACQWLDKGKTEICGVRNEMMDWRAHFALAHGINAHPEVPLEYCFCCGLWFPDWAGDGVQWEEHQTSHFQHRFGRFEERSTATSPPEAISAVIALDVYQRPKSVRFELQDGFEGKMPEFHGNSRAYGTVLVPYHCGLCVFDTELPMAVRMKQFGMRHDTFVTHVKTHLATFGDGPSQCPVPSCGTYEFSYDDLMYHLVVTHRIPLFGSSTRSGFYELTLPTGKEERKNIKQKRKRTTVADNLAEDAPPKKFKGGNRDGSRAHPKVHYCDYAKCRREYADIRQHLADNCGCETFRFRLPHEPRRKFTHRKELNEWLANEAPNFRCSECLTTTHTLEDMGMHFADSHSCEERKYSEFTVELTTLWGPPRLYED